MKLREIIKKELGLLTEQSSNYRNITYKTCNGSMIGSQAGIARQGQVPEPGDILRINTYGSLRTVMVLGVSPNTASTNQLQNAQCQSSCPNCNAPCFNWTTMQNCDGTTGDPDCVVSGNNGWPGGTPTIECGSCGCGTTPPPPPPPSPSWDCNNGVCTDPGTGNGQYSTISACQANCTTTSATTGTMVTLATCQIQGTWGNHCRGINNLQLGDVININYPTLGSLDMFVTSEGGPCPANYTPLPATMSSPPSGGCPAACPNAGWSQNVLGITDPTLYTSAFWVANQPVNGGPHLPQGAAIVGCPYPCDPTPLSPCATQWFGNNASNFNAWMAGKDCSNYQSVVNQLEPQAITLMTGAPTPQPGPYNNWSDIKNAANASGLINPQKGQFKRKMAKAMYAQCQIQACNC